MDMVEAVWPAIRQYIKDADSSFFEMAIAALSAVMQIHKGALSEGMKRLLAINSEMENSDFWFQRITIDNIIAKVYLEILKGEKSLPLQTILKNPEFILRHAFFAAKRAKQYLMRVVSSGTEMGATGFVAQAHLDLGRLFKLQKRYTDARRHLEAATEIFEETGGYAFLKDARDELSTIP